MPICFVVHLFITIVNDGYLSEKKKEETKPIFEVAYLGNA